MKHSILFVVSKPDTTDYKIEQNWHGCVSILSDLTSNKKGVLLLAENVALIPLHETLDMLAEAVRAATNYQFQYKYAIFDEEIKWYSVASKV